MMLLAEIAFLRVLAHAYSMNTIDKFIRHDGGGGGQTRPGDLVVEVVEE